MALFATTVDALNALVIINGSTLLAVVVTGFRVARHLGKVETWFALLVADYKERKGIK